MPVTFDISTLQIERVRSTSMEIESAGLLGRNKELFEMWKYLIECELWILVQSQFELMRINFKFDAPIYK